MILITGGTGYLGQYLIKTAPSDRKILIHTRREMRGNSFVHFDLRENFEKKLEPYPITTIIHTAACSSVQECEMDRSLAWNVNVEGTKKLIDFAQKRNIRFIYISTDLIFDGKKGKYTEKDAPNPINQYGLTKRHGEIVAQNLDNVVIIRSALIVGKPIGNKNNFTNIILQKLKNNEKVPVFYDELRSPIWVMDLVKAIWKLVDHDFKGIIHLGGSEDYSRAEMAEILCRYYHLDPRLLVKVSSDSMAHLAPRPKNCTLRSLWAQKILSISFASFEQIVKNNWI